MKTNKTIIKQSMKNRQHILKTSIKHQEIIVEPSMKNLLKIIKNHQKWIRKLQMASMMHQLRRSFGFGWVHKHIILIFPTIFLNSMVQSRFRRPAADLTKGSGLSLLEVSNL